MLRWGDWALSAGLLALSAGMAVAQSYGSSGQSWSSSYGFASAADRSLRLQQAQVLRQVEGHADPTTVYNTETYYDNRTGYIETNAQGSVTGAQQIGDQIGQQTYSVGSLNTGSNTIEVHGNNNTVDSVNSAETDGCVDGSIREANTTVYGSATAVADGTTSNATQPSVVLDNTAVASACK